MRLSVVLYFLKRTRTAPSTCSHFSVASGDSGSSLLQYSSRSLYRVAALVEEPAEPSQHDDCRKHPEKSACQRPSMSEGE